MPGPPPAALRTAPRMHQTVRFAEPLELQQSQQSPSLTFRLPRIGQLQPSTGSTDAAAASAIYDRHGYSPPRSPGDAAASQWKYPLPSKSFRLYIGPPHRQVDQPNTSLPASCTGDIQSGLQLQRSHTEPTIGGEQQQHPQCLPTPYVQSRAEIFLRRRFPPPPMTANSVQPQLRLRREATELAARSDEETERLRWTMSTQRHWQVDRKGQQRNQGPFSREFTVHVTAPSNWMRMKWGRKQLREDLRTAAPGEQRPSYMYTKQAFGQLQPPPEHGYYA